MLLLYYKGYCYKTISLKKLTNLKVYCNLLVNREVFFSGGKTLAEDQQFSFINDKNSSLKLYKQPLGLGTLSVLINETDSGNEKNTGVLYRKYELFKDLLNTITHTTLDLSF